MKINLRRYPHFLYAIVLLISTTAVADFTVDDSFGRAIQQSSTIFSVTEDQYSISSIVRLEPLASDKSRLAIRIEMIDGGPSSGWAYNTSGGPQFKFSAADNYGNVRGTSTSMSMYLPGGLATVPSAFSTGIYDRGWINISSTEGPTGASFKWIPFCVDHSRIVIGYSLDSRFFGNMAPNGANQKGYIFEGGKFGLWFDVLPPNRGSAYAVTLTRFRYDSPLYGMIGCNTSAILNLQN